MSRKRIDRIYPRDRAAMAALGRTGHISHQQLGEFLRDKRISDYCKEGLLQKTVQSKPGDGQEDKICYRLSTTGREFCRRELHMDGMYRAQSVTHDMGLADRYFSLTQEERNTWQTESQAREEMKDHIEQLREQGNEARANALWDKLEKGEISPSDAIYTTSQGVCVAFEVITTHYGHEEILEKMEFCEELELAYSQSRV